MSLSKKYSGVIVPMITPFLNNSSKIDEVAVSKIIDLFITNKVHPFIIGTTGEAVSISPSEKERMVELTVAKAKGKAIVYAGISSNCFDESVEFANRYAEMGVDVVVATPPAYYPMDDNQLVTYFSDLADAVKCPLIIYNMPATTNISIPLTVVEKLSHHKNIVGLKDSERDEERLTTAIEMFKDRNDFSHLLGWAARSADSLEKGSDGIVPSTGNFAPELYTSMYEAALKGDFEEARRLQDVTDKLGLLYQKDRTLSKAIPDLKSIMNVMEICGTQVLPPMYKRSSEDEVAYQIEVKKELQLMKLI